MIRFKTIPTSAQNAQASPSNKPDKSRKFDPPEDFERQNPEIMIPKADKTEIIVGINQMPNVIVIILN